MHSRRPKGGELARLFNISSEHGVNSAPLGYKHMKMEFSTNQIHLRFTGYERKLAAN